MARKEEKETERKRGRERGRQGSERERARMNRFMPLLSLKAVYPLIILHSVYIMIESFVLRRWFPFYFLMTSAGKEKKNQTTLLASLETKFPPSLRQE